MQVFTAGNAMLRAKTMGNYPNANYIMSCVYEGMLVDIATGLKIESRYFFPCPQSKEARNMIRSLFFSIGDANKMANRPKAVPPQAITRIAILGPGWWGAGRPKRPTPNLQSQR